MKSKFAGTVTGVVTLCTLFAAGAKAQCGSAAPGVGGYQKPTVVWQEELELQADSREQARFESQAADNSEAQITGLWKAVQVSGGVVVDVGYDQWHSDGTEILVDNPPPASGNVCVGVWEKTGPRTYSLIHPAFNFDSKGTTVVSIFILRQQVTLSADGNSYSGTFTWDTYDFQGHPLAGTHVAGTVTGKRIKVGGPFPFPFPL